MEWTNVAFGMKVIKGSQMGVILPLTLLGIII